MENKVLNYKAVMSLLQCKKSKAYEIIHILNKELEDKGYLTLTGKVPSNYFFKRLNLN